MYVEPIPKIVIVSPAFNEAVQAPGLCYQSVLNGDVTLPRGLCDAMPCFHTVDGYDCTSGVVYLHIEADLAI